MAGIAGALYVPQVGIINPSEFAPANSIEVVIWVAVGGRGTLVGPIVGALLVNFMKSWFTTGTLAQYWPFMLGGLFVLVTLLLPKGIVGTLASLFRRERRPAPGEATPPLTPAAREDLPPAATNPAAAE
jgi:urea transport system permease protein